MLQENAVRVFKFVSYIIPYFAAESQGKQSKVRTGRKRPAWG